MELEEKIADCEQCLLELMRCEDLDISLKFMGSNAPLSYLSKYGDDLKQAMIVFFKKKICNYKRVLKDLTCEEEQYERI